MKTTEPATSSSGSAPASWSAPAGVREADAPSPFRGGNARLISCRPLAGAASRIVELLKPVEAQAKSDEELSSFDQLAENAESIMQAATHAGAEPMNRERFARLLAQANHDPFAIPDVDLLIRSGGEQRLSDFLLWECAYAEFYFARCMWPEFSEAEFLAALRDFESRDRRFGGVNTQVAS